MKRKTVLLFFGASIMLCAQTPPAPDEHQRMWDDAIWRCYQISVPRLENGAYPPYGTPAWKPFEDCMDAAAQADFSADSQIFLRYIQDLGDTNRRLSNYGVCVANRHWWQLWKPRCKYGR